MTGPSGARPGSPTDPFPASRDPGDRPVHEMRRRDRKKNDRWIRSLLDRAPFGCLATVDRNRPFLNSNLFVYAGEPDRIYLHTHRTGRTTDNVSAGGPGTFSAAVMGRLLPHEHALEFSVGYAAVVAFGEVSLVRDEEEKREALEGIMEKYAPHLSPGRDYRPITERELGRTSVHRLDIEAWSGKEKVAPPDFPGAYLLPELRPPVEVE